MQQEQVLEFTTFTNEMALELGLRLIESIKHDGKTIAVNISKNGQVLFYCAMPGVANDSADWIRRKNNVVNRSGHSSYYVGVDFKNRGTPFGDIATGTSPPMAAHLSA